MALPPSPLYRFLHHDPLVVYRRLVKAGIWNEERTKEQLADAMAAYEAAERRRVAEWVLGSGRSYTDGLADIVVSYVNDTGRELSHPHLVEKDLSDEARAALRTLVPWHRRLWRALAGGGRDDRS